MSKIEKLYSIIWFILTGILVNLLSTYIVHLTGIKKISLCIIITILGIAIIYRLRNYYFLSKIQKKLNELWNKHLISDDSYNIKFIKVGNKKIIPELFNTKLEDFVFVYCKVEYDKEVEELFKRIEKPILEELFQPYYKKTYIFPHLIPLVIKFQEDEKIENALFKKVSSLLNISTEDRLIKVTFKKLITRRGEILVFVDATGHSSDVIKRWIDINEELIFPKWINKVIIAVSEEINKDILLKPKTVFTEVIRYPTTLVNAEKLVKEKINYLGRNMNEFTIRNGLELLALKFSIAELLNPGEKKFNFKELKLTQDDFPVIKQIDKWILEYDKDKIWNKYKWNPKFNLEKNYLVAYGLEEANVFSQLTFDNIQGLLNLFNEAPSCVYVRLILDENMDSDKHKLSLFKKTQFHLLIKELWDEHSNSLPLSDNSLNFLRHNDVFDFIQIADQINLVKKLILIEELNLIPNNFDSFSLENKASLLFDPNISISSFCKAKGRLLNDIDLLNYFNNGNRIPICVLNNFILTSVSCINRIVLIFCIAPYGPLPSKNEIIFITREILNNVEFNSILQNFDFDKAEKELISKRINLVSEHLGELAEIWLKKMHESL